MSRLCRGVLFLYSNFVTAGLRPAWRRSWVASRLSWTLRFRAWRGRFPRRSSVEAGVRYWAPTYPLFLSLLKPPPPPFPNLLSLSSSNHDTPCRANESLSLCLLLDLDDLPAFHSDSSAFLMTRLSENTDLTAKNNNLIPLDHLLMTLFATSLLSSAETCQKASYLFVLWDWVSPVDVK